MKYPRVLITTYHHAFFLKGGGEYEIFSVADMLKQQGMIVDIYGPYSRTLDDYDVILHFSVYGNDGLDLLRYVKSMNKPVILWPNLWVKNNDNVSDGLVNSYLELSDAVIFKSLAEKNNFMRYFSLEQEKCRDATLCVDGTFLQPSPPGLFQTLYGLDKYAIWFGVIEPGKNQLMAVEVLREKGIKLVLVGNTRSRSYLQSCLDAGGDDILVIPNLPYRSSIMRSALQSAMFYIEVGHEPAGLSAIEAGLSGCKMVLSDTEWSREHFSEGAYYADPDSKKSISEAVDSALATDVLVTTVRDSLQRFCLPKAAEPLVNILQSFVP